MTDFIGRKLKKEAIGEKIEEINSIIGKVKDGEIPFYPSGMAQIICINAQICQIAGRKFNTGGCVEDTGDRVAVRVNAGESVLSVDEQDKILALIIADNKSIKKEDYQDHCLFNCDH